MSDKDPKKPTIHDRRPAVIKGEVAEILIGVGGKHGVAQVDAADAWVDQHNWHLSWNGYPQTTIDGKMVKLHRLLLGKPPVGMLTDHKNRDRLDNRRSNLRFVTPSQNQINRQHKGGSSRYRGVVKTRLGTWQVAVRHKKRLYAVGTFDDEWKAAQAYNAKARELHGEFAYQNVKEAA